MQIGLHASLMIVGWLSASQFCFNILFEATDNTLAYLGSFSIGEGAVWGLIGQVVSKALFPGSDLCPSENIEQANTG